MLLRSFKPPTNSCFRRQIAGVDVLASSKYTHMCGECRSGWVRPLDMASRQRGGATGARANVEENGYIVVDALWYPTDVPEATRGRVEIPVHDVPWLGTVLVNVSTDETINAVKKAIADMTMEIDWPVQKPWTLGFFSV